MVVENSLCHIEKLEKGRIGNGIVDVTPRFPPDNDVARPQNRKLLGDSRLFNLKDLAQLIHAFLAIAKAVKDSNTDRVSESLEKLGFEVGKLLRHAIFSLSRIL